jgi:hypothetical protein
MLSRGVSTRDMGGTTGTREFGAALVQELKTR